MPIEIIATKKDLLKAIRSKCGECMGGTGKISECTSPACSLYPLRFASVTVPDQCHLFKLCDKEDFLRNVLNAANEFQSRPFAWSDLRSRVKAVPLVANWYGAAAAVLRGAGFRIVDNGTRSTFKSRHGAMDRIWRYDPLA